MSRPYIIDSANNRMTFTDLRLYYHPPSDDWLPSSTTILEAYPKTAQFYEWLKQNGSDADRIRDEAGETGSVVHNLTELYDNGDVVSCVTPDGIVKYSTKAWSYFERYVEFSQRFNPDIIHNELQLTCEDVEEGIGYGGTIDRIIEMDGKRYLMDIKTSGSIHNHYWLQLASYVKLYEKIMDEKIDGICILWLNAKTRTAGKGNAIQGAGWQMLFPDKDLDYYWELFKHTYSLWYAENKDFKPRNLSYQLSHSKIKKVNFKTK